MESNRLPAIKYFYYFPNFLMVDKIRNEIEKQLAEKKVRVIFVAERDSYLKHEEFDLARQVMNKFQDEYILVDNLNDMFYLRKQD